jgi:hypothetical protein
VIAAHISWSFQKQIVLEYLKRKPLVGGKTDFWVPHEVVITNLYKTGL